MTWYWKDGTVACDMDTPGWEKAMRAVEEKHRDLDYKRVARTELPDGGVVSTVWIGLDHNYGKGPPLIFESMFFKKGDPQDLDCDRYATEEEALAGHTAMVATHTPSGQVELEVVAVPGKEA